MSRTLPKEKSVEESKDYSYVQPVELKNPEELKALTKIEKQLYEEKLRLEIFEHDHRQQVYKAKRDELLEIETAYRYLQKQHEQRHGWPQVEKKKTQAVI